MTPEKKVAKSLLRQKEPRSRRRQMLVYAVVLVALFAAYAFFTNLDTPLKLIPQMMAAIIMGYVLLALISLGQFKYIAEFIDWDKVTRAAEANETQQAEA